MFHEIYEYFDPHLRQSSWANNDEFRIDFTYMATLHAFVELKHNIQHTGLVTSDLEAKYWISMSLVHPLGCARRQFKLHHRQQCTFTT